MESIFFFFFSKWEQTTPNENGTADMNFKSNDFSMIMMMKRNQSTDRNLINWSLSEKKMITSQFFFSLSLPFDWKRPKWLFYLNHYEGEKKIQITDELQKNPIRYGFLQVKGKQIRLMQIMLIILGCWLVDLFIGKKKKLAFFLPLKLNHYFSKWLNTFPKSNAFFFTESN